MRCLKELVFKFSSWRQSINSTGNYKEATMKLFRASEQTNIASTNMRVCRQCLVLLKLF